MKKVFNQKTPSSSLYDNSRLILPPVSTTSAVPVANLPLLSFISVVHLHLRISPRIFEQILNDPSVIFGGLGEMIQEEIGVIDRGGKTTTWQHL
jgi:hypothetical protein